MEPVRRTVLLMENGTVDFCRYGKPFPHVGIDVGADAVAHVFRLYGNGFLVEHAARYEIADTLAAARNTQVVVLCYRRACHQVYPVDAFRPVAVRLHVFRRDGVRTADVVQRLRIFVGVQQVVVLHHLRYSDLGVQYYLCRALRTAACRYEDYAVGAARTVNGSRGGIFQNLHRLYVLRIDAVETARRYDAVDDVQRVAVFVYGGRAAHAYLRTGARHTARCRNFHSGSASLQNFGNVFHGLVAETACAYGRYRACEVALFYGSVTDHHDIVHLLAVCRHPEIVGIRAGRGLLFGGAHADERDFECAVYRYRQYVLTVRLGYRAC